MTSAVRRLAALSILAAAAVASAAPATQPASDLPKIILAHFDAWDTNHNGTLGSAEIDAAITSPDAFGPQAAAMVTLRRAVHPRSFDPKMPKLTKAAFEQWDDGSPVGKALDDSFDRALKQVQSRPKSLYPATETKSGPNISCMRQGQVGDCFFIAPTGALTFRDPDAVKKMITELPNNAGYRVTFATGQTVDVPPITDAEYAFGASTRGEGLWLPVLEQAYGRLKMPTRPAEKQTTFYTDAITVGGMSKNVIALYTGHGVKTVPLRSMKHTAVPATRPDSADNDQANAAADLDRAAKNREDLAVAPPQNVEKLRAELKDAVATHHLITAGALGRTEDMPPDMSPNHVYAIVGYDADKDVIQVWNPHGQDFTPKGPDNLKFGYTTHHGRFDIPTADFVQVYHIVTIETDEPAPTPTATTKPSDVTSSAG